MRELVAQGKRCGMIELRRNRIIAGTDHAGRLERQNLVMDGGPLPAAAATRLVTKATTIRDSL